MQPTLSHAAPHATLRAKLKAGILAAGLCVAAASHAQSYQFIDLGVGNANGINNLGQVVGASAYGATLWNGSSEIDLVGGLGGVAYAINDSGQIVGNTLNNGTAVAASWKGGLLTNLSSPGLASHAYGINDAGLIVGNSSRGATLWLNSTSPVGLVGVPSYFGTSATAINSSGVIAGVSSAPLQSTNATVWNGPHTTILPNLSGDPYVFGGASAIDNAGVVVGSSSPASMTGATYAMEWNGTSYTKLGSLGGSNSFANSINNAGTIVGSSSDSNNNPLATIWKGTTAINLNRFLTPAEVQAGWVLTDATGINSKGWIVGDAYNSATGANDAFLLEVSPVPEAASWQMLLAGLALLGGFAYLRPAAMRKLIPCNAGCARSRRPDQS